MKLHEVNIAKIRVPETRVTAVYDEDTLKLLRDTVDKLGILQPVILVGREGNYELVDGLHRLEEARRLGDQTIEAVVYEGGAEDSLMLNLILNRVRGKTKASEMVAVIGKLYQDMRINIEGIEEKTGLPRGTLEKYIVVSQAAPSVRQALDQELIGIGVAFELARLPTYAQQDKMVATQQVYHWSVKEMHDFVDQVLADMQELKDQPDQPEHLVVTPEYRCEACKDEVHPRYLRPVALCPACFGNVWELKKLKPSETEKAVSRDDGQGG